MCVCDLNEKNINNNLKLPPYKMRKRQYYKPVQIQKILDRAKILRDLKAGTEDRQIVFYNQKRFTIEPSVKNQNDRVYEKYSAVINEFVRTVYHRQKSFSLMVWAAVSKSWNL